MSAGASRGVVGLLKRGWNEVPELLASGGLFVVGVCMSVGAVYHYYANDGDNRKYKKKYTVYRHDDPRVPNIRKD